ncbi:sorting nexin-24 [Orussus abietinus]|uniref:sorting nexin-24 n=1 Tax=Orussus abietinus TaxID=222816 RepID=UPI0006266FC8|nr:sorting nexin-24 [Orussus abietinus]
MYQIFISGYRLANVSHGKPYYVYSIEVILPNSGMRHLIEKRYSEFNALHRMLKKECDTVPFPPKRVRNSQPKVLEQRRAALELYMQKMLRLSNTKQQVLNFLGIEGRVSAGSYKRMGSEISNGDIAQSCPTTIGHHPVITFQSDPYVHVDKTTSLPDIVTNGVLLGVYKS